MKRDPFATDGSADLGDQYRDERTEKKIHEHLSNEKDIITEEDIANAPVGPVNKEEIPAAVLPASGKETTKGEETIAQDEKVNENMDPGIETAWNVLES